MDSRFLGYSRRFWNYERFTGLFVLLIGWLGLMCATLFIVAKSAVLSFIHPPKDLVEVKSPDGRYVARAYHILPNGDDPGFTYVVIYPNDFDFFYRPDNLLVVERIEPFKIEWKGRQQLVVEGSSADADIKTSVWRDVKVEYVDQVGH